MGRLVLLLLAAVPALATSHDDLAARLAGFRAASLPDSVEVVVDALLPGATAQADTALIGLLLLERGKARVAFGRAAAGEGDLRRVLALADGRDEPTRVALRYLAEACQQLGRHDEAARVFGELEHDARAAGDDFHAGKALYGLGRLRYRARELAAADSLFVLALPLMTAAGDSAGLAALHNSLGNALGSRGAYRDAADHYTRAVRYARAGQSRSLEAMAANNLAGVAMIVGDPALAVTEYRRARDIQAALGLWRQMGAPWRNLVQALADLGRLDEAQAELVAALSFARTHALVDDEALALVRLAALELAHGDATSALASSEAAIALGPGVVLEARMNARLRAAEALTKLGHRAPATAQLDSAAALIADRDDFVLPLMLAQARARLLKAEGRHELVPGVLMPALERTAAARVPRYRLPLLVVAADAWFALGQDDSTVACLNAAERLWEQERVLPTDPLWRERRGVDAQLLFTLRVALAMRRGDHEEAFAAVQRYKARTLLERIIGPGAQLPTHLAVPAPVMLAALQREVLRPGEVLLDAFSGPGGGWLFVVTTEVCHVWPLPDEERWQVLLAPLLAEVAHPFSVFDSRATQPVFEALLAAPEARAMVAEAASIIVCPDGSLHRIPYSTVLPHQDIRRIPSATILAHLRRNPQAGTASGRILAVAGQQNATHRRLDGAMAEVEQLRGRFREVTVATVDPGGIDLAGHDVLHLACHTEVDPQRPWNSALILGTAEVPVSLRAGDVAALTLDARLAVLSSCSSADGGILAGEGVVGLATGFLGASVPTIVATLWPVDDVATARFMDAFYSALGNGATPAAALAIARARLQAERATAHPFYWAAFVIIGDGDDVLALRPQPGAVGLLIGLGASMVAAALILARRRRQTRRRPRS